MAAYYNEIDPHAAEWLRRLIAAGHIAAGEVDERSIEDVTPDDLRGFTQCHFFAGIGVWSHALRRAGWSDDRPVWTGSCPCQPFSAAGRGSAFADERHLWPDFFRLIQESKPSVVFGEQVASKVIDTWIDLVQTNLETLDYAFGAVPFPSAGVGAPHIRDRLYWVAHTSDIGQHGRRPSEESDGGDSAWIEPERLRASGRLGNTSSTRLEGSDAGTLGYERAATERTGPTNGYWRDADWISCRDGKSRPVRPGTFPLVNGAPARVGRLRAYGNAINAEAARVFIEATNL